MLAIFQLASLLGIIIGYGLGFISNAILKNTSLKDKFYGWRLCFLTQGIFLIVIGIILMAYPKLYFSTTFYLNKNDDFQGREKT